MIKRNIHLLKGQPVSQPPIRATARVIPSAKSCIKAWSIGDRSKPGPTLGTVF